MYDALNSDATEQSLKLPEQLEPFLTLLGPLPICRICQAALLPKSVIDHLRKHHQLPVELRSSVRSLVAALPSIDFNDVPNHADGSTPVDALHIVDAFQCNHCSFIRRDVTDVRKHINQEHKISAASNYTQIQAQSWFGGRRAVYWRVCVGATGEKSFEQIERESTMALCAWGLFGKGFGHMTPKAWSGKAESDTAKS